ncbi:MAG: hypothetical protein ACLU9S_13420 [Oscillospiraceae bacterium]
MASDGTRIAYKEATVEGKNSLLASLNGTLEYVDSRGMAAAAEILTML